MQVVRIDRKGRALDHVVALKKAYNENVVWVALGTGGPWKVAFDKGTASPFKELTYTVPPGGAIQTQGGPLNGDVSRTYKYSVSDPRTNTITDDPDVDIE
jgi:hypothetical protein